MALFLTDLFIHPSSLNGLRSLLRTVVFFLCAAEFEEANRCIFVLQECHGSRPRFGVCVMACCSRRITIPRSLNVSLQPSCDLPVLFSSRKGFFVVSFFTENGSCLRSKVFNEDDPALLIRQIPAQLVKADEDGLRHVSMHVAVKCKYVRDFDNDASINHHDCFPETLSLTCKSARKNEFEPSFKAILKQEVLLHVDGSDVDLMLLGANLDTDDESKLGQLQALERMLNVSKRGSQKFAALIWGDFNNRLVAFEDMKGYVSEKKGKFELTESGARFLVDCFTDPAKRLELLKKDSLTYSGRDIAGQQCEVTPAHGKLLQMFHMTADRASIQNPRFFFHVPMPSYKHTPLETVLSDAFKHRMRLEEVVCLDSLRYVNMDLLMNDVRGTYFGWADGHAFQHVIAEDDGCSNLYLQLGWPDGVGLSKSSTISGEIVHWQSEWKLRAQYHLPMRSMVMVHVGQGTTLKVWLGFIKVNRKLPTIDSLHELLYGDTACSISQCDVIALYLTDVFIAPEDVQNFRCLLTRAMKTTDANEYLFNEDDPSLLIRQIPAQLVKSAGDGLRHVSMHVAVSRRLVKEGGNDASINHHDCFPETLSLTCKSARKNEFEPSFKAILKQEVLLHVDGSDVDLMLLGANLDTDDESKLGQLQALERMLNVSKRGSQKFAALIWGDFNNRLVAFEDMKGYVSEKKGKFELTESGARFLVDCFTDPAKRLELLKKDSLTYSGRDLRGEVYTRSECSSKMKDMPPDRRRDRGKSGGHLQRQLPCSKVPAR